MDGIDLALALCIVIAGIRGLLRGFFREAFALLGLVSAIAAAFRLSDAGTEYLEKSLASTAPQSAPAGVAFVAIFLVTYVIVSSVGFLFERYVGSSLARMLSAIGGAALGTLKGAAVAAFIALFIYLFVPSWSGRLMKSQLAQTLVHTAGNALRSADPFAAPAAFSSGSHWVK